MRRNKIGDDGARTIAAILAERSAIKLIDLRENNIGIIGIKAIAEALERSERVQKVFVHPGGKIEAMGATESSSATGTAAMDVVTVCVVDVRDNKPMEKASAQKREPPSSGGSNNTKSEKRRTKKPSLRPRPTSGGRSKTR